MCLRSDQGFNRGDICLVLSSMPSHQLQASPRSRSCRSGSSSIQRVHKTRGQICLSRCPSPAALYKHMLCLRIRTRYPPSENRSSCCYSRQARAHVTCWPGPARARETDRPIEYERNQPTCPSIRRSGENDRARTHSRRRARQRGRRRTRVPTARSFLWAACPVNPRPREGDGG